MTELPQGIAVAFAMIFAASTAYLAGRVHEWRRQNPVRRAAYRKGYDRASAAFLRNR